MHWLMRLLVFASLTALFIVPVSDVWCSGVLSASLLQRGYQTHLTPAVVNVTQEPIAVEYFNSVNVTVSVANATDIAGVELSYQVDTTDWQTIGMANVSAQAFSGVIPPQNWNSQVRYYINITDLAGHSLIEDNGTSYYRYVIGDTVKPLIRVLHPLNGERITGFAQWDLEFYDAGSCVDRFCIYLDNEVIAQGHANGVSGGVRTVEGVHVIRVDVYDLAGNLAREYRSLTVENPTTTIPGFPIEAIAIALIAGLAVALLAKPRRFKAVLNDE